MKKITVILLAVFSVILLAGCVDKKTYDTTINVYFFTANSANASKVETLFDVGENYKIEEPEEPTYTGHAFIGWYKDDKKTVKWDFEVDRVGNKSIVLFAKWEAGVFNIYYELNGGTMPEEYPTTFKPDRATILVSPIRREGYSFVGWFTYPWVDESSTKPGDKTLIETPLISEDLYLYAHWRRLVRKVVFRINYPEETGAPSTPGSISVTYHDILQLPTVEDTNKYIFIGWNTRADGSGDVLESGQVFEHTQNVTLYAQWQAK